MTEEVKKEEVEVPTKEELLGGTESVELKEEAPQYSEVESRAMENGWTPKDQWKGDPAQWRPADVWLDRGEFLNTIQGLRKELHATKAQVAAAWETGKKLADSQLKKEVEELKSNRREALNEGDFAKADELDEKIDELKEKSRTPAPKIDPKDLATPPEFHVFVQRNPWYNQDPALHYAADGIGYEFMRVNPHASAAELYHFVEQRMRERFPETGTKGGKVSPPSPDGGDRQVPRGGSAGKQGSLSAIKSNMSEMERGIMKTLIQTGTFKNEEEYLKQYADAPGRN